MAEVAYRLEDRRAKASGIYARHPQQWYVEPVSITLDLIRHERFEGTTWDPACGMGNICRAFHLSGLAAIGTDLVPRATANPWWVGTLDFLADETWLPEADNLACNAPFYRGRGTERFIRKALRHARGKVAMFTEIRFLASGRRADGLYAEFPPTRIWHTGTRVSCPPGEYILAGQKPKSGQADWCWIIWDRRKPGTRTETGWFRSTDL